MSSSEEEFESADESFDGDKEVSKCKITNKSKDEVKKTDDEKNVNKTSEKVEPPKVEQTKKEVAPDTSKMDSNTTEKIVEKESEDGWEDFDEWPEETSNPTEKVVAETKNEKKVDILATSNKDKDEDNDGWDDWGDDDDVNAAETKPVAAKVEESPNVTSVLDKLATKSESHEKSQSSWGGWKPWGGVVSLISTASEGVAHLTTNVSKGISNVLESGMGIPDPEDLARMQAEEKKKSQDTQATTPVLSTSQPQSRKDDSLLSLGQNFVTGVTQISNRVITGGLDTLEGIGKKTMTMLQENDPLLINKRKMLGIETDRPVLSQVLREAKEKTEEAERNLKHMQKHLYKKQIHFETLFDDYHGLVHLEALEMLSKQSALKLQSLMAPLSGKALQDLQETLGEVNELCELPEPEDDADGTHAVDELSDKLKTAVEDLGVTVDFTEIIKCWDDNGKWLDESTEKPTEQEIHDKALHCLAQTTALAVHKMHKLAEVLLVLDHHSTANEADSLVQ